jgi:hypothetical protein
MTLDTIIRGIKPLKRWDVDDDAASVGQVKSGRL